MTFKLLLVVGHDSDGAESIRHQRRLYFLVQLRARAETGQHIDFKQPRLKVMVEDDVEAKDFETQVPVTRSSVKIICEDGLNRDDSFDDQVFHLGPCTIPIESFLFESINQCLKLPLRRALFSLFFTTSFLVICGLFVYAKVGQMGEAALPILSSVRLGGETH